MGILAFDTNYADQVAKTVCICFQDWIEKRPSEIFSDYLQIAEAYQPGSFYKRELPCIIHLLKKINLAGVVAIIIDGFVILDDTGRFGLGGYLFEYLHRQIPVIGVAKTNFATLHKNKRLLYRGKSTRPLYITSLGMDVDTACRNIKVMYGKFRMPDLLKMLDTLTKER